jgi:hypothetical protein
MYIYICILLSPPGFFLVYFATSLGDWCRKFRDSMMIPYLRVECQIRNIIVTFLCVFLNEIRSPWLRRCHRVSGSRPVVTSRKTGIKNDTAVVPLKPALNFFLFVKYSCNYARLANSDSNLQHTNITPRDLYKIWSNRLWLENVYCSAPVHFVSVCTGTHTRSANYGRYWLGLTEG